MRLIFICLFSCFGLQSFSQLRIEISSELLKKDSIKLESFYGHKLIPVTSFRSAVSGNLIQVDLPEVKPEGFYRLSGNNGYSYDLILTNRDSIQLTVSKAASGNGFKTVINKSKINKELNNLKDDLTQLRAGINQAEVNGNKQAIKALQQVYNELIDKSKNRLENKTYRILAESNKYPSYSDTSVNYREHYCKGLLNNAALFQEGALYSTILPSRYFDYLSRCTEYSEEGFKKTVDTLLVRSKIDTKVYDYTLYYLLELFESVGPEVIFNYLVNKYLLAESCIESESMMTEQIKKKVQNLQNLLPGKKAPAITFKGHHYSFEKKDKTLLLFWSSYCPYCKAALITLNKQKLKGIEVLAISLDTDTTEYSGFLNENKITLRTDSDFKGWDGERVEKYAVSKTPLMVLIDQEGKIEKYDIELEQVISLFSK